MTQIQLRRGTASEWAAANPILAAGEVGVIGTTGDFKIGDGATTWNLLPAQSSRYAPLAGAGCRLTDAVNSIASGGGADITWGTEVEDVDGWTAGGSATLTCPAGKGGRYTVSFTGAWGGTGTSMGVVCFLNGTIAYSAFGTPPGLAGWAIHTLTFRRLFTAGDTLRFQAYQNSGGAVNIGSTLDVSP